MTPEPSASEPSLNVPKPPPGIESVVSAEAGASPCELPHSAEIDAPFWTPGWTAGFRQLGWRWILLLPAPLVVAAIAASVYWPLVGMRFWVIGLKPAILLLMLPFSVVKRVTHASVQKRKEPFCIHCGYGLSGLPDNYTCPECGRAYTLAMIEEYRRNPEFFIRRWRTRGDAPVGDVPFAAGPTSGRRRSRDGT